MPDGDFHFMLKYIDHGVKFLFSIPLTRKREICIAVALLEIFTVVGPPMILQSDNGNEFNTAAMTSKQVNEFCGKLVQLTAIGDSQLCFLCFDSNEVNHAPVGWQHSLSPGSPLDSTVEYKQGMAFYL
jgi:hypothetical protein